VNLTYGLASAHATCVTPFFRIRFGTHANGWNALLALLLILVVAGESRDFVMFRYLVAWLIALVVQRAITLQSVLARSHEHSLYRGFPWVAYLLPWVQTEHQAKAIEPILCLVAGGALAPLSPALGMLIMSTSVSMFIVRVIELQALSAQMRQMRDAEIEHRQFTHNYRNFRNLR
jgi:hypothetical protein